jgi:predicted DNA-binding transcriptional regulator YafY
VYCRAVKATQKKSARLNTVLELLQVKPRTFEEISQRLELEYNESAVRKIQRDFEDLRANGYSIDSDDKRPATFTLTRQPPPPLKADEALAIHIALRLLYHHTKNPPRSYLNALEKITPQMPPELRHIAQMSLPTPNMRDEKLSYFEKIANCWTARQTIAFDYLAFSSTSQKIHRNELEIYFVEISRSNFEIYVIGRRVNFEPFEVRTFKLSQMRAVTSLKTHYEIPEDFDPQRFLSNAWGVIGDSTASMLVRLKFDPSVSRYVRDGRFPGMQSMLEDEDGGMLVTIKAGKNNFGEPQELMPFIRGWGSLVQILEPLELRQKWLAEARTLLERYAGDTNA